MPMQIEEARGLLFQVLRQPGWNQTSDLAIRLGDLKAKLHSEIVDNRRFVSDGRAYLDSTETALLNEIIWSLIIQGIIVPGLNDSNQGWPFLRLTEYGMRCVEEDRILPHDPDGYLKEFRTAIPSVDPIVIEYLTESVQCFLRGLNRASAVMLGAASEQAVLLLIESYVTSIGDPNKKTQIRNQTEKAPSIFRKYEIFEKQFSAIKPHMPKELTENADSQLRGVFDLIRNSRNDAGHPAAGTYVSRDSNYSRLRLFVPYCQRIYELMSWFTANPT
jgi:hypothetical protein